MKSIVIAIILIMLSGNASAQWNITGGRCVFPGVFPYGPYIVSGPLGPNAGQGDLWKITGGTINGASTFTNPGMPVCGTVSWNTGITSGTLSYHTPAANPTPVFTLTVNIYSNTISMQLPTGHIFPFVAQDKPTLIKLSGNTVTNTCTNSATMYTWQKSVGNTSNWVDIPNSNSRDFDLIESASTATYFRRKVFFDGLTHFSDPTQVVPSQPVIGGLLMPSYVQVKAGTTPLISFTPSTPATGGVMCGPGMYSYYFETSTDNINWTQVSTGNSYLPPGPINVKTYLRQRVQCGPLSGYSTVAVIDVYKTLKGGTINPFYSTVTAGTSPGKFNGNPASGGNPFMSYTYEWQVSTDGQTFTPIGSTNALSYDPGNISALRYYRRKVSIDGEDAFSNIISVNVGTVSTTNQNMIVSRVINKGSVTTEIAANALTALNDVRQGTSYLDGFGKPSQLVNKQASQQTGHAATDQVTIFQYDKMGREPVKALPYTSSSSDGLLKTNPNPEFNTFHNAQFGVPQGENFFFAQNEYEASPVNRVDLSLPQGNTWVGSNRGVKVQLTYNTINDIIRIWAVGPGSPGTFGSVYTGGYYLPGALNKTITTDENGKQVIEFKDKEGNLVLKKVQNTASPDDGTGSGDHTGWLCTYFVYDDQDNLKFVAQPKAVELLVAAGWQNTSPISDVNVLNELSFRYEYDQQNRVIMKKLPGAGEVYCVYDGRSRKVMSQDAKLRAQARWQVYLYDEYNRVVQTGLYSNGSPFAQHLTAAYNSTTYPFTPTTTPSAPTWEYLTKTGYDNYTGIPGASGLNSNFDNSYFPIFINSYNTSPEYAQQQTATADVKGFATWTETKVLGTPLFEYTVNIYDDKGRVLQIKKKNFTGGTDLFTTQYRWNGQPLIVIKQTVNAETPAQTNVVVTKLTYDDLGRIIKTEKKVGSSVLNTIGSLAGLPYATISTTNYDKNGQVMSKNLGNKPGASPGTPLSKMEMEYNIRGWLLSVNKGFMNNANNDQYLALELGYDKNASFGSFTPQYNGNVSGMLWKSEGDQQKRKFNYSFDAANRFTSALFTQYESGAGASAVFGTSAGIDFTTHNITYDANGNILTMMQRGLKLNSSPYIDVLTYNYGNTNKLNGVVDGVSGDNKLGDFTDNAFSPNDYTYDVNGNLLKDLNKKIGTASIDGISYNHLNLPWLTQLYDAVGNQKGNVWSMYDAAGTRLRKVTTDNSTPGTTITVTTTYIGEAVFETKSTTISSVTTYAYTNRLLFISHEEGRFRFAPATVSTCTPLQDRLVTDYFIKDYLGNVRMMLTEQKEDLCYLPASVEDATLAAEQQLYDIVDGRRVLKATTGATQASFQNKLYQTHGNIVGQKTGLGITMKVMAGDKVKITAESFYTLPAGGNPGGPLNMALADLLLAFASSGPVAAAKGVVLPSDVQNLGTNNGDIGSFITRNPPQYTAKAYLNWILFDEQLRYVNSGADPVNPGTVSGGGVYTNHTIFVSPGVPVTKNGYLYVFVSNESNLAVYFDNLNIIHTPGPIMEETHYYAFGLSMQGISSKANTFSSADNDYKFNGIEHNMDFGLNIYEAFFRTNDPQIGRWLQIDPKGESFFGLSPYNSMGNNPVKFTDPFGDKFDEESQKYVDEEKKRIKERQKENAEKLKQLKADKAAAKKAGDANKVKELNKQISTVRSDNAVLNTAKTEIAAMERSSQNFQIKAFPTRDGHEETIGLTTYREDTKTVLIGFDGTDYSTLLHELSHGYDFISGEMAYKKSDQSRVDWNSWSAIVTDMDLKMGSLYDIDDEYKSWTRSYALDATPAEDRMTKQEVLELYRSEDVYPSVDRKNVRNSKVPANEITFKTQKN